MGSCRFAAKHGPCQDPCTAPAGIHYHLGLFLQPNEQGYAYALICTSTALSQVVGGPMAALIMLLDGVGLRGWRWLLLLEGLPSLAVGLYILVSISCWPKSRMCCWRSRPCCTFW